MTSTSVWATALRAFDAHDTCIWLQLSYLLGERARDLPFAHAKLADEAEDGSSTLLWSDQAVISSSRTLSRPITRFLSFGGFQGKGGHPAAISGSSTAAMSSSKANLLPGRAGKA